MAPAAGAPVDAGGHAPIEFDGDWPALARSLAVTGLARQCVDQAALVSHDADGFTVRVPIRPMADPTHVARVREALAARFGRPVRLTVEVGAASGPTLAALQSAEQAERQGRAQAAIDGDPFVRALVDEFGATVMPGSVKMAEPAQPPTNPQE